jgi:signal transduction histidine kinase
LNPEAVEPLPAEHFVQFYDSDDALSASISAYVADALRSGQAGLVVATPEHRASIESRLAADHIDLEAERAARNYVALDAAETLARIMSGNLPSEDQFSTIIGSVLRDLGCGPRRVAIYGEMVGLLSRSGRNDAALRLEEFWNDFQRHRNFSLGCGYAMPLIRGRDSVAFVEEVCLAHSRTIPAESYTALGTTTDRLRAIAVLQQKARLLEVEVAERRRAEDRLQIALAAEREAHARAEAALQLRNEFLSVAAHELKTPLTALTATVQLLLRTIERDAGAIDRARESLRVIDGQAHKLSRLIVQLLDVSRLEIGRFQPNLQPVDLVEIAVLAVESARRWNLSRVVAWEGPASLPLTLDPLLIDRVITNLLDNAFKFSPKDSPVDVRLNECQPCWIELSVRDHGSGIPLESRERIFDRFYQAHTQSHQSGLGIGLYVSQQIAQLHAGDLRVEFPSDGGSRFVLRLPRTSDADVQN